MYDLIIIGGGPAAVSAGIYAARKKMKTMVIADKIGGQSVVSVGIENWIGTKTIAGWELAKKLEEHLRAQENIEIIKEKALKVFKKGDDFAVTTEAGKKYESKTVLVCSGGRYRRLNVPGEEKFIGKGVAFCSSCDAPLFRGKDVAVVGAGNSGLEAVLDLASYANKIYLLSLKDKVQGDPSTYDNVLRCGKAELIYNALTKEILGDNTLSGLKYIDTVTDEEKEIPVSGVFVEIGMIPNSDIVKDLVELNERQEIKVDLCTGRTSVLGIWAAGDITNCPYKQNNIASGDAARAALDIYGFLQNKK